MQDGSRGLPRTEVKARVLRALAAAPEGRTKAELVAVIGDTSRPTVQRCLTELKDDAVVQIDRSSNRWLLVDSQYRLSLDAPEVDDLHAVLIAEALLGAVMDDDLRSRLRSLAERLDERIRQRQADGRSFTKASVEVSFTSATRVRPEVLNVLLHAVRTHVVQICFTSPWSSEERKLRLIEPWALRLHDSSWYVRAYDRKHSEARTFRLAHIHRVSRSPEFGDPRAEVPSGDDVWTGGDPAFGIDHDRPGVATVVLKNPIARWLSHVVWHPEQDDEWIGLDLLQRRVPYASVREFARTLRSFADGVVSIEPAELREAVFEPFRRVISA